MPSHLSRFRRRHVMAVLVALAGLAALPSAALAAPPVIEAAVVSQGERPVLQLDRARLDAASRSNEPITVRNVPLGGEKTIDLSLRRFHVASRTQFVVGADNRPLEFDADKIILLRGEVIGEPGSHVYMAISPTLGTGLITLGPGRASYRLGTVNSDGDVLQLGVTSSGAINSALTPGLPLCGLDAMTGRALALNARPGEPAFRAQPIGVPLPESTQHLELAIETDYEFFILFGDLDEAATYVAMMFGAVSDIYLRDVNTWVELSFVRLWDDPDDLFNAENPLNDLVDYWNKNMKHVDRDVVQFFSGRRDMPFGGIAYLSALCSENAYGVVGYALGFYDDPLLPGINQYDIHVTAHELGHNCGTLHTHSYDIDTCDDLNGTPQRGTIMSYCSQTMSGGNTLTDMRFHTGVQGFMREHIFEVECVVNDCNQNGSDDSADIGLGSSDDDNGNGIPDECEDCNDNGILDDLDIILQTSEDDNNDGVPDECQPDCNDNGLPDDLDIANGGGSDDENGNGVPDECEPDCNNNKQSDYNEIQANMTLDIDRNVVLDDCQDCDNDGTNDLDALNGAHNTWVASLQPSQKLAEFHAISGALVKHSDAGHVDEPQDLIITTDARVFVSSGQDDSVVEFDRTGAHLGEFVAGGAGGLNHPNGMVIAPNGNLLVCSGLTDSVLEYDRDTGAYVRDVVAPGSGGLDEPFGIAFGPNGSLFVTSNDNRVIEYNFLSGAPVGDFVTAGDNGGLDYPRGLLFHPDGDLLVASSNTNSILRYNGATGAFIEKFNLGGTESALTLDEPWTLRLGPDGNVYCNPHVIPAAAASSLDGAHHHHDNDVQNLHINSTRIYVFDVENGNFLRSYVIGNDTGLDLPTGFDFMPGDGDCNFNQLPDSCDIASGASKDANGNGVPDECEGEVIAGDLDGDGAVGPADLAILLGAWGPCPDPPAECPADLNGDGSVGPGDLAILLGGWG